MSNYNFHFYNMLWIYKDKAYTQFDDFYKYTVYIHFLFPATPFGPLTLIYPTEGSNMTCLQESSP